MSTKPNSSQKIAKFRTFAEDAKTHANQTIDEVRTDNQPSTRNEENAKTEQKEPVSTEVVNLDQVDTSDTTETKEKISPIPEKNASTDKPSVTPTKEKSDKATEKDDKDISNPPFHKLDAERKKATEKISSSSETITNHPESLLSGEKKQTVNVNENEATAEATIVTDTKTSRKGVLTDIGDSVTGWFSDIKNTYITPPKPSYTVSKSERRAGILQDATGKTGTGLMDHDSFAARIRQRYQNATQDTAAAPTETAWQPSLPPGNKRKISDVKTVPRKGVQTLDTDTKDVPSETPHEHQAAKNETAEKSAVEQKKPATPKKTTTPVPDTPKKATAAETVPVTHTSRTTNNADTEPTKPPLKAKETATTDTATVPATTAQANPKPAQPDTRSEKLKQNPETNTEASSAPSTKDEEMSKASPQTATRTAAATDAKPEPLTEITSDTQQQTKSATPTKAKSEPATQQVKTDEYVLPSDEDLDAEAIWEDRQATNRLSIGVVLGTTVAVVAAVVVYSIAPLFMDTSNDPEPSIAAPFGDETTPLAAANWNDALARTQAMREAMNADISTLHYVTLTEPSGPIVDPVRFNQLLSIDMPVAVQTIGQALYAGNYRGTPFLYLHAPDTPQIFGALLSWETSMTNDLQSLLPITDYSGTFVDMVIDDKYDARVKQTNANTPSLVYTIAGDYVIITTSPEAAEVILSTL